MRQQTAAHHLINSLYFRGLFAMRNVLWWLKLVGIGALLMALAPVQTKAQSFEIGGGYSYVRANLPPDGCGCFSLNGGSGWVGIGLTHHFSLVGEVAGQHGSNIAGTSGDLALTSYLFGPRYTVHRFERSNRSGKFYSVGPTRVDQKLPEHRDCLGHQMHLLLRRAVGWMFR